MSKKSKELNPFAKRLKHLIEINESSQQKVAEGIGVTRQALNKWVNGDCVPDISSAAKLAKLFGVSTDYLIGRTDVMSADPSTIAMCNSIGISDIALDNLRSLYNNKNDNYNNMSDFLDDFIAEFNRKTFYEISNSEVLNDFVTRILELSKKHFL